MSVAVFFVGVDRLRPFALHTDVVQTAHALRIGGLGQRNASPAIPSGRPDFLWVIIRRKVNLSRHSHIERSRICTHPSVVVSFLLVEGEGRNGNGWKRSASVCMIASLFVCEKSGNSVRSSVRRTSIFDGRAGWRQRCTYDVHGPVATTRSDDGHCNCEGMYQTPYGARLNGIKQCKV